MKIVTDIKEMKKYIGDWPTVQIYSEYEMGSNQIKLKYDNKQVIFQSNNIKDVAYIALECHAITNNQYRKLS
ncbi:hypothetical protein [Oceanobacillus kimchii]|uniref:Uncharacterized protein n=1 Tax=Oceanobacillus kimchii TaxID=746691 RepID=A0ABQ5TH28_9BACI|nr:hypothetical protein [Oceanobacillus kimchii]GLO66168.1 hypothetical protein MACH08_19520 [Oceanobacillus kimchii]